MARHHEESHPIQRVRATSEKHSPPTLRTSHNTLPTTIRHDLPSDKTCAWTLQKKAELRSRSFHVRRRTGYTWDASFWEQDGSNSESPLKGKSRHTQSGELSLRDSSNGAFAKHSKRQGNPYYHANVSDIHSATIRRRHIAIPRPSTVLTLPRHRQLDGTTELGECSTVLPRHRSVSEATDNSPDAQKESPGQIDNPPSPTPEQLLEADIPYSVSLNASEDSIFSSPSSLPLGTTALDTQGRSPNGSFRFPRLRCKDGSLSPSSFHLPSAPLRLG